MKRRAAYVLVAFLSLALSVAQPSAAQTIAETTSTHPRLVRFGGTVKDLNGNPLEGVVGITFALYSEQTGGAALWLETQNVTADSNGRYVALLGSTKPYGVPTELFTSEQARWVGVQVSGQPEQPRVLLVSAPYALKAVDADTLGGKPASAYLLNPQPTEAVPASAQSNPAPASRSVSNTEQSANSASISGSGTKNYIPRWTSSTNLGNSVVFQSTSGDLGIGTTSPLATLDIRESTGLRAIASGNVIAVYGNATVASGTGKGVEGDTSSTSGTGVAGVANATTGSTLGMWGANFSTSGVGVLGQAYATSGNAIGVEGLSASSTGTAGLFNNTGGGKILSGQTSGTEVFSVSNSGVITGSRYQIGSNLFAFGSYANANAFLGFAGNPTMTGTENTAGGVGALQANTTGYLDTAYGYQALYSNTTGGDNTAIGDTALYNNLSGGSNTAVGVAAMVYNTSGVDNTAIGLFALSGNTIGNLNTASGELALTSNTTGQANTANGASALLGNTTGQYNTASGYLALGNGTTGQYNTANGYQALGLQNTTGGYNTAIGASALAQDTTGVGNTGSGYSALANTTTGFNNSADGFYALLGNTTGSQNTGVGLAALQVNTTGSWNTAVGTYALNFATGSYNTALGSSAGPDRTTPALYNSTAIGAYADVLQNNTLVLGSTAGQNGSANVSVGIDVGNPSNILTVLQGGGPAIADGWSVYSSRRWKTNIQTLHGALEKVVQLRGVSYNLKDNGKHEVGVIAEEVGAVVPEVVSYEQNGKDARGVDYSRLTALLIEATKEQQAEIRDQKSEIQDLQERLSKIEAALSAVSPTPVSQ